MAKPKNSPAQAQRSPLTLLATTALAVSNLIVGILQENTFLIAASAVLAGVFAVIYLLRIHRPEIVAKLSLGRSKMAPWRRQRFPLSVFVAILFVALPALFVFMRVLQPQYNFNL
jgi:membrane associated rhomboid family serine protease